MCEGFPVWVDPTLKELAASLVMSTPAGAPTPGCSIAPAAASREVDASLVDSRSPSLVQGPPQVTPPRG